MAARLGDDLLSCAICYEQMTNPKVLPCLHSFCESCIQRHYEVYSLRHGTALSCPSCREMIPLPHGVKGASGFRNDAVMMRIKDLLMQLQFTAKEDADGDEEELLGACAADPEMAEERKRLQTQTDDLQKTLAKLRSQILQIYTTETKLRVAMKVEISSWKEKPEVPEERKQKWISQIEQRYSLKLAQMAVQQDHLYQSLVQLKPVHDILEELLSKVSDDELKSCLPRLMEPIQEAMHHSATIKADMRSYTLTNETPEEFQLVKSVQWVPRGGLMTGPQNGLVAKLGHDVRCRLLTKITGFGHDVGKFDFPTHASFTPGGEILVSDKNNQRLQVFDIHGDFHQELLKGRITPRRAKVSPFDSCLYVCDELTHSVKKYSSDGKLIQRIGENFLQCPAGLDFDRKGNIVMSDVEKCYVLVYSPEGEQLTWFYFRYPSDVNVPHPYFTAVNEDNQIMVSDMRNNQVKIYSNTAQLLFKIKGLVCPRGICYDPYGNILIAEGDKHCVSMYSSCGKFIQNVITREHGLQFPLSLDMNASGQLLVTQCGYYTPHEVLVYQLYG